MKGYSVTVYPKRSNKALFYFVICLLISAVAWILVWPVVALYWYAPFIFLISPSPNNSEFLGKVSDIELDCHKTWIWGYYATEAPWDQTFAFYKIHGYAANSGGNQYLSRSDQGHLLLRQVMLLDRQIIQTLRDEPLRTNIEEAFDAGRTVYTFSLSYTENVEAFEQSYCRGD
jgi:hypothetical protein